MKKNSFLTCRLVPFFYILLCRMGEQEHYERERSWSSDEFKRVNFIAQL